MTLQNSSSTRWFGALMAAGLALAVQTSAESTARADEDRASTTAVPESPIVATVNLNTATEEELTQLPGIGPAKARAIVEQRNERRFERPEDVMRVKGIGRAMFRRLRPMLTVSGRTSTAPVTAPARR